MSQISHPTMGSPCAMVTSQAELVVVGSRCTDKSTNAQIYIDYAHHEIHDGNHYNVRGFSNKLGSGLSLRFEFTTPNTNKWTHLLWQIEGTTQTEFRTFEGATLSGGTLITAYNNNRNSTNTAATVVRLNPVVSGTTSTSGTIIEAHSKGLEAATPSKATINAVADREDEWILKSGTTYLFEFKSVGADNIIDYAFTGYDHTDKEKIW